MTLTGLGVDNSGAGLTLWPQFTRGSRTETSLVSSPSEKYPSVFQCYILTMVG